MRTTLIAAGLLALLWGLHRFLSYAEDRGWVYYRKKRGSYGGLAVTRNFLNHADTRSRWCGGGVEARRRR